jgi:hypothetical protein
MFRRLLTLWGGVGDVIEEWTTLRFDPATIERETGSWTLERQVTDDVRFVARIRYPQSGALSEDAGIVSLNGLPVILPLEHASVTDPSTDSALLRWALEVPQGMFPITLLAPGRTLMVGVDFHYRGREILLLQNPVELWPDGVVPVRAAWSRPRHPVSYALEADQLTAEGASDLAKLRKSMPGYRLLEKAAAVACGFEVVRTTGVLSQRELYADGSASYLIGNTRYHVTYPHAALALNQTIVADTILGQPMALFGPPAQAHAHWWRKFDWTAGLQLDGNLAGVRVTLPDRMVVATAVDENDSGLLVELNLGLPEEEHALFWAAIRQGESMSGQLLASHIPGLTDVGDTTLVNPIDLWFTHSLARKTLLVYLHPSMRTSRQAMLLQKFLGEERPLGMVTLWGSQPPSGAPLTDSSATHHGFVELTSRAQAPWSFSL